MIPFALFLDLSTGPAVAQCAGALHAGGQGGPRAPAGVSPKPRIPEYCRVQPPNKRNAASATIMELREVLGSGGEGSQELGVLPELGWGQQSGRGSLLPEL